MRLLIITAAWLMALAVILGAFGAHGLKQHISAEMLAVYQTGVQYHFYHALGLMMVGMMKGFYPQLKGLNYCGGLFVVGILVFSGSLYILAITGIRWLGMITPIGGVAFVVGWALLAITLMRNRAA